ncbi:AbrB/MazE/SpoVT family DNA-binding domain-containing protein [Candidatus Woesearchaeota archaeon]|nr:AbrB/MazE/SpoVT family DNA-binding domain-containing protein [Candidatus Woesearchaeota archaeon]
MELKTIKLSEKGQISIPKDIRRDMRLKKGDKLVLMTRGKQLILQKADLVLKKLGIGEESMQSMMASEAALKKDWDNKYDERWNRY